MVSNTSPVSSLATIGYLELLRELYGQVLVPEAVRRELARTPSTPRMDAVIQGSKWVETRPISDYHLAEALRIRLHAGESEAIVLALELKADLLLMDERRGRRIAAGFGLNCVGLLGVLAEARSKALIPAVRPVLDALISKAGFWVSRSLYDRALGEFGE